MSSYRSSSLRMDRSFHLGLAIIYVTWFIIARTRRLCRIWIPVFHQLRFLWTLKISTMSLNLSSNNNCKTKITIKHRINISPSIMTTMWWGSTLHLCPCQMQQTTINTLSRDFREITLPHLQCYIMISSSTKLTHYIKNLSIKPRNPYNKKSSVLLRKNRKATDCPFVVPNKTFTCENRYVVPSLLKRC